MKKKMFKQANLKNKKKKCDHDVITENPNSKQDNINIYGYHHH